MKQLLNEKDAATYLGYSIHSLRKARLNGQLGGVEAPKFTRIGTKTVRYNKDDLDAWIAKVSGE